jgi:thymidylate synthase
MDEGEDREGRNGLTRALFGLQLRFNLEEGFPAVTTKKLAFRSMVAELLWFIKGSGDDNLLKKLLGKERTIWTDNAEAPNWKGRAAFPGDLGRIYGVQWRHWRAPILVPAGHANYEWVPEHWEVNEVDQLVGLMKGLREDPFGRRHVVTAWNPGELDEMALPPCHMLFQLFVHRDGRLSLHMVQRSCDMFLGVPFNIASYALLLSMIAQVTGMRPYECVISLNDAHIYHEHFEQVKEQLSREPKPLPKLWLHPEIDQIWWFGPDDVRLLDYKHHPAIEAKMIV